MVVFFSLFAAAGCVGLFWLIYKVTLEVFKYGDNLMKKMEESKNGRGN